jgi:hypothetical protein
MEFKAGQSFRISTPSMGLKYQKIHIDHVLKSKVYSDQKLIVYRWYSKYSKIWRHDMCELEDMYHFVQRYERVKEQLERQK